jgi:hypothetical protein
MQFAFATARCLFQEGFKAVHAALLQMKNPERVQWVPEYACAVAMHSDDLSPHLTLHCICLDAWNTLVHRCFPVQ